MSILIDNQGTFTQELGTLGGQGAGIDPILLASYVDFMRAEMALEAGTGENAMDLTIAGATKSIDKVYSFTNIIPGSTYDLVVSEDASTGTIITVGDSYLDPANLAANKKKYLDDLVQIWNDVVAGNYQPSVSEIPTDLLDVVMKEYMIAAWGNGYEAYNNLRRTGRPLNHAPMAEPAPGIFAYSSYYPANHVNFNPNATQKSDLGQHVFWDTNPDTTVR